MSERVTVWLLKPKSSPYFMLQWIDPETGGRVSKSTKTTSRKQAKAMRTDKESELNDPERAKPEAKSALSWERFVDLYVDEKLAGQSDSYAEQAVRVLESLEGFGGVKKLSDVTERVLSQFVKHRREQGRSVFTIRGNLAAIRAALQWAADQKLIAVVPLIPKVKAPKKRAKGRPLAGEEFDRMLAKCPNQTWRDYLTGLWLSGMRLSESIDLWWDRPDKQHLVFSGKRPMIVIPAETEKGGRDRRIPLTPDFAEFLESLPGERKGRVFDVPGCRFATGRVVSKVGREAGVKVSQAAGKVKYASAHDLRRSFGTRWAKRLMPAELMVLMRHENIETTMTYYVDLPGDELAERLWAGAQECAQESPVSAGAAEIDKTQSVCETTASAHQPA